MVWGGAFFKIDATQPPNISATFASVSFACSTFFMQDMRVRMFTSQPDVCHMLFFKDTHALYRVKLSVVPLQVSMLKGLCLFVRLPHCVCMLQAFVSHRLLLDITFFSSGGTRLRSLLPVLFFVDSLERQPTLIHEDPHFKTYRRAVLRGHGSDDFWIMAERVWRKYSC